MLRRTSSRIARRPAGAGAPQQRLVGDRLQPVGGELELDVLELEHLLVLAHEGVLRLGEDLHQRVAVEAAHGAHRRQAADELGDHPVLDEVLGQHLGEQLAGVALGLRLHRAVEADALVADAALDDLLQPGERPTQDEQHVRGVDLDELLVRVLAPALRRHRRLGALEDLQQRLLHALARDVPGDRRVLALAGDLVDLVDVDDPRLGPLDVEVGGLDQLEQDVLDVLADVAGLGEGGGVGDGERHVEQPGERLGEVRLAAARSGRAAGCSTSPARPRRAGRRPSTAGTGCAGSGCRRRPRGSSWRCPGRRRSRRGRPGSPAGSAGGRSSARRSR